MTNKNIELVVWIASFFIISFLSFVLLSAIPMALPMYRFILAIGVAAFIGFVSFVAITAIRRFLP